MCITIITFVLENCVTHVAYLNNWICTANVVIWIFYIFLLAGVFFGGVCIGMAGVASLMGSVLQVIWITMNTNYCSHLLLFSFTMRWKLQTTFFFSSLFFSGRSFYIWHDKRTAPWSLSIRHVFSHIKLNSEYFLALRLLLAQLHNLITHKKKYCQSNKNVTS